MLRFLKNFFMLLLGVLFLGLVLALFTWWAISDTRCKIDETKPVTMVTFVGHTLVLPTANIEACYEKDGSTRLDHDPAHIKLEWLLPDFSAPLNARDMARPDSEISLWLTGVDPARDDYEGAYGYEPSEVDGVYKSLTSVEIKKDDTKVIHYGPAQETPFGLILHETNGKGMYGQDIYVRKDAAGKVDLMIKCDTPSSYPDIKIFQCHVGLGSPHRNVAIKYVFHKEHLPQWRKIHRHMSDAVTSIMQN